MTAAAAEAQTRTCFLLRGRSRPRSRRFQRFVFPQAFGIRSPDAEQRSQPQAPQPAIESEKITQAPPRPVCQEEARQEEANRPAATEAAPSQARRPQDPQKYQGHRRTFRSQLQIG